MCEKIDYKLSTLSFYLAIFSDSFKDMDRIESIKYLLKRARKYRGTDLQPISFTIQNYEEKLGIVEEVLNTGIEVFISS